MAYITASGAIAGATGAASNGGVAGVNELLNGATNGLLGPDTGKDGSASGSGDTLGDDSADAKTGESDTSQSGGAGQTTSKGANDGAKDILAIIDENDDAYSDSSDSLVVKTLSTITGLFDRVEGKEVPVHVGNKNFLPPEGYTTADEDKLAEHWSLGKFVIDAGDGTSWPSGDAWFEHAKAVIAISNPTVTDLTLVLGVGTPVSGNYYADSVIAGGTMRTGGITLCVPGTTSCPTAIPTSYLWPVDNTFQLAQYPDPDTGIVAFRSHPRDPNVTQEFKGALSKMLLSFDSGTRNALIEVSKAGGVILSEVNPGTGAIIGAVRVYRNDGTFAAYTDADGIGNYRP